MTTLDMDNQELLRYAILAGDLGKVKSALASGSNVNSWINGRPPTCIAIENGQADIAIHLIKNGADVSLPAVPRQGGRSWWTADRSVSLVDDFKAIAREIALGFMIGFFSFQFVERFAVPPWEYHLVRITNPQSMISLHLNSFLRPLFRSDTVIADCLAATPIVAVTMGLYGFAQLDPTGEVRPLILSLFDYSFRGILFNMIVGLFCTSLGVRMRQSYNCTICTPEDLHKSSAWQIATSYLKSGTKSEPLLLTLLDHKLLSKQYVRESLNVVDQLGAGQSLSTHLLRLSAELGYNDAIRRLVNLGVRADLNLGNELTALCIAARHGRLQTVKILLELKARVDGIQQSLYSFSSLKSPLLECLSWYESEQPAYRDVVEVLIDHKANVQLVGMHGKSALHLAVERYDPDLIRILLRKGADLSLKDDFGKTPSHYASHREDADELLQALRNKRK